MAEDKDWKKEALALAVLLRAKCSEEEWASMESRFAVECRAPAPQPEEFWATWAKANPKDAELMASPNRWFKFARDYAAATPQVTPTIDELVKDLRDHYNTDWDTTVPGEEFNAEIGRIVKRWLEGTSEQASPTPDNK